MSHELRTPLNAIIGYSELLQEEAVDSGQTESVPDLERIHSAGKHLLGLINDILDLSKVEAGKMTFFYERFDINKLIGSVVSTINPMVAKNGNTLEVICAKDLGAMHSDLTKVRQCLLNLLSNACKFTDHGTIRLEVRSETEEAGDNILLTVADSGIGMTPEQMGRLFQAFSQAEASTSKNYGGTGLGLALTKNFCNMLGGDLTVTSEIGKGSIFTIRIPRTAPDAAKDSAPDVPSGDRAAPDENKTRVLAIDDDPSVRDLIHRSLTKAGYYVETCPNGEQGLTVARAFLPHVILLDVILPGIDGWSVLNELKRDPEMAKIPVVMVSFVEDQTKGFSLGVADYFTKPIDWDRLEDVLNSFRKTESPKEVLVVEDDKTTRELLRSAITAQGLVVQEAENGAEALDRVNNHQPGLILLDLIMPVMNGFEFIRELHQKEEWRQIPIIVMTAKDITDEDRRALSGEVTKVLQKGSYGLDELLDEIRRVTHHSQRVTPSQSLP